MTIKCPKCYDILSDESKGCACGWKKAMPELKPPSYRPLMESYRENWYAERGLPYEPPKIVECRPFRSVGGLGPISKSLLQRLQQRCREPGDDDEEIVT